MISTLPDGIDDRRALQRAPRAARGRDGQPAVLPRRDRRVRRERGLPPPALQSSLPVGLLGHESGFAPDGKTFYATSLATGNVTAVDLTNPKLPVILWVGPVQLARADDQRGRQPRLRGRHERPDHPRRERGAGAQAEPAGARGEPAQLGHAHDPAGGGPRDDRRQPVPRGDRRVLDRAGRRAVTTGGRQPGGAGRIIDISDEKAPKVVSDIRLEVNQPENRAEIAGDPGANNALQGYAGHYCSVPQRVDPGIVACSFIASGLRVFDIRDPYHPKEIAYFTRRRARAPRRAAVELRDVESGVRARARRDLVLRRQHRLLRGGWRRACGRSRRAAVVAPANAWIGAGSASTCTTGRARAS